jgi:hypothetical protein
MNPEELGRTLGRIEAKLEDIGQKVDLTNGRVRGLELFKARVIATTAVMVLLAPVALARIF